MAYTQHELPEIPKGFGVTIRFYPYLLKNKWGVTISGKKGCCYWEGKGQTMKAAGDMALAKYLKETQK